MRDQKKLMNFELWSLNESATSASRGLQKIISDVVGDRLGDIHVVPDFETFERPGEPEQTSVLVGTGNGSTFTLNYAGDKFYSVDLWGDNNDSMRPDRTVYAEGNSEEQVLSAIFNQDTSEAKVGMSKKKPLVLQIEGGAEIKVDDTPKKKTELNKEAAKVPVVPSVSKKPGSEEMKDEYDYQDPETIFEDLKFYTNLVIDGTQPSMLVTGSPGVGKCHRKGDRILMFDMSIKNVEDIECGDLLMGDDSTPRLVLSLARGRDTIYQIKPKKGKSFFVNADHILCTINSLTGKISETSVKDFISLPAYKREKEKLYKVSLSFVENPVEIDPYWLGLWLGDGCSHSAGITIAKTDPEILDYHTEFCEYMQMEVHVNSDKRNGGSCSVYTPVSDTYRTDKSVSINRNKKLNPILEKLRLYGLSGKSGQSGRKFIPLDYIRNSRRVRLQLLAGIIDSDGSKVRNGCYEIVQKSAELAGQIAMLARSLGYHVHETDKVCSIKSIGFSDNYSRILISGANDLPCKVERKKSTARKQVKNVLRTGFDLINVGEDDYYGFMLSGNGRYLMSDFIVTHNTFTIEQEIKKAGLKKNVDYFHAKGKATAAGMYQVLWENNGKLILFDDMDSIFKDDNAVNILKGALDSGDVREISWLSSRPLKNADGELIPQQFDFTGRVIFISNLAQRDVDPAIKTRSFVIEVALSPQDMVRYLQGILKFIMPYERLSLKQKALDKIWSIAQANPKVQVNARTLMKTVKILVNTEDSKVADRLIEQQCSYK